MYIVNNGSVCFILSLARFTLCDGELSTLTSTKELQIPHRFRKRSVLNVFEAISKSQHNTYIIYNIYMYIFRLLDHQIKYEV